jgi:hypothetical protein
MESLFLRCKCGFSILMGDEGRPCVSVPSSLLHFFPLQIAVFTLKMGFLDHPEDAVGTLMEVVSDGDYYQDGHIDKKESRIKRLVGSGWLWLALCGVCFVGYDLGSEVV